MSYAKIEQRAKTLIGGGASERIELPCRDCGGPSFVTRAGLEFAPPSVLGQFPRLTTHGVCDACEIRQTSTAYTQWGAAQVPDMLGRAELPKLPTHPLDTDLAAFLRGKLNRIDGAKANGLLVYGVTGSGKSTQVVNLARMWVHEKRQHVLYRTEGMLYELLRNWDRHAEELHRLRTVPLLIVDDLGTHKSSDWTFGMFYEVVDGRYAHGLATVFGTNYLLTIEQAEKFAAASCGDCEGKGCPTCRKTRPVILPELPHIDARIWRRMKEMCHPVRMDRRAA